MRIRLSQFDQFVTPDRAVMALCHTSMVVFCQPASPCFGIEMRLPMMAVNL